MRQEKFGHKSVAVKNKLLVVDGCDANSCEVFDLSAGKFAMLSKLPPRSLSKQVEATAVGGKIFVFLDVGDVLTYDFENKSWSWELCKATRNVGMFSCVKKTTEHVCINNA